MEEFFTIKENVSTEITEKKSKFIANLFYINTKSEAEEIIKTVKKQYHDARHNCIAYRVIEDNKIIERFSDDGEPSGTAGAPMLDILKANKMCNVLIVVTRYFGGILLGTGGLVRAYSDVTLNAIELSHKVYMVKGVEMQVDIDYNNLENFKYYCKNNNINITYMEYLDVVICKIELEINKKQKIIEDDVSKKINIKNIKVLCEKYINKSE